MDEEKLLNAFGKAFEVFEEAMVKAVLASGGSDEDIKRLKRGMPAIASATRNALNEQPNRKRPEPADLGWPVPDNRPAALLTAWITRSTAHWPVDICMVDFGTYGEMIKLRQGQEKKIKEKDEGVTVVDTVIVGPPSDDAADIEAFAKLLKHFSQNLLALHALQRIAAEIWRIRYTMEDRRYL